MKRTPRAPSSTVGKSPSSGAELAALAAARGWPRRRRGRRWRTPPGSPRGGPAGCGVAFWAARHEVVVAAAQDAAPGRSAARAPACSDPPAASRSAPAVPIDADPQVVLVPDGDLRREQHAADAALEAQQQVAVVVEAPALHERRQVGADVGRSWRPVIVAARFSACEPMSPIAPADAGARRVGAPVRLLVGRSRSSSVASQPWLYSTTTLRTSPSSPRAHHVARLAHQRVARVVVGHAEDDARARAPSHQVVRLLAGVHERLVADDVEARLDERLGDGVVHVVGRHDGDEVDAVVRRPRQLAAPAAPARSRRTRSGARPRSAAEARARPASEESAPATSSACPSSAHGLAVHGADERVAPAADHAVAERRAITAPPCRRRRRRRRRSGAKSSRSHERRRLAWRRARGPCASPPTRR